MRRATNPLSRSTWRVEMLVPAAATPAFEAALAAVYPTVSAFETGEEGGAPWRVEIFLEERPDPAAVNAAVAAASLAAGLDRAPGAVIAEVPPTDWLTASYAAFPPIRIGRFVIHGSHVNEPVPPGRIGLEIDAATAFGSGEHPTTALCLAMMERLARAEDPARILDMGSGTGILAFAGARLWSAAVVLAADNDPESVRVGRENARRNGLRARVRVTESAGFASPAVATAGPYDLVLANILARPLMAMAGDLAKALAPGGTAVLSGLLTIQEPMVLWAYRQHGLALATRLRRGAWSCLAVGHPTI